MYNVYGVTANTYREACEIAGVDGPDHDFDAEFDYYEWSALDISQPFNEWRAEEAKRAWYPQPLSYLPY